jgi:hypothetical protein
VLYLAGRSGSPLFGRGLGDRRTSLTDRAGAGAASCDPVRSTRCHRRRIVHLPPESVNFAGFGLREDLRMSDDQEATEREFRRVADAFIDRANDYLTTVPKENVGMSLLFAAARFNAFVVASHSKTPEKYDADRAKAIDFFTEQYLRMLEENLDDYRRVYDRPPEA